MNVVFFHRKPRPGNFSIEKIFVQIRSALPREIDWRVRELMFFSTGFFRRLISALDASLHQQEVNHVTGDIHFIVPFLMKKRTVLTVHDIGWVYRPNRFARELFKWFWIVIPLRRSAIVTTVSNETKNELLKYCKVDPGKIRVIYNPISDLFVRFDQPFNKTEPRILQIGTKPNKNLFRLIEAIRGISCVLDIVGHVDTDLIAALDGAKVKYCISKNLSETEMIEKYHESDIVAFASIYEGFGLPIVEANAVGRVVVTSNVSSMPEVAGDAAHLVDPLDPDSIRQGILKVIQDDDYRQELINRGFINKKRFDLAGIARQYADIYSFICGPSRS